MSITLLQSALALDCFIIYSHCNKSLIMECLGNRASMRTSILFGVWIVTNRCKAAIVQEFARVVMIGESAGLEKNMGTS